MVVGICTLVIHLPYSRSLKDKRKVVKSLKDRLRARHNISVAEVDSQDLWQRAVLGIAAIGLCVALMSVAGLHVVALLSSTRMKTSAESSVPTSVQW